LISECDIKTIYKQFNKGTIIMAKNLLEQLNEVTVVVADTGDLEAIATFKPRDATTNPSLITAAAQMPQYQGIVDDTLKGARETAGADASAADVASLAFERLAVSFGLKILEIIPGRVSTEVDARLSYDTEATIAKGREIIAQYEAQGISKDRILIKIASTWEGIKAAEVLEKEGIHCNLTHVQNTVSLSSHPSWVGFWTGTRKTPDVILMNQLKIRV
jgi:transaldolase